MKTCNSCKKTKDFNEFGKLAKSDDGHSPTCKQCRRIVQARYRASAKGKENRHLYQIEYRSNGNGRGATMRYQQSERGKETHRKSVYADIARNPEKARARKAVTTAVYRNKIPAASSLNCSVCGKGAKHYHHHKGYDREFWFDVVPVCVSCHVSVK